MELSQRVDINRAKFLKTTKVENNDSRHNKIKKTTCREKSQKSEKNLNALLMHKSGKKILNIAAKNIAKEKYIYRVTLKGKNRRKILNGKEN